MLARRHRGGGTLLGARDLRLTRGQAEALELLVQLARLGWLSQLEVHVCRRENEARVRGGRSVRLKEEPQCCACFAMSVSFQATPVELLRPVAPREWTLDQAFQPRDYSLHVRYHPPRAPLHRSAR